MIGWLVLSAYLLGWVICYRWTYRWVAADPGGLDSDEVGITAALLATFWPIWIPPAIIGKWIGQPFFRLITPSLPGEQEREREAETARLERELGIGKDRP
jgi:hypothetical protein